MDLPARACRHWTEEEDEFLLDTFGTRSFRFIGNKLGRSMIAVERRARRLGLTSTKAYGGWHSATSLGDLLGVSHTLVIHWAKEKGLPNRFSRLRQPIASGKTGPRQWRFSLEEFWEWAEEHQDLFNLANAKLDLMLPVPQWAHDKQEREVRLPLPRAFWSQTEDQRLLDMRRQGVPLKEIAVQLGRTLDSVDRRQRRLRAQKEKKPHGQTILGQRHPRAL